MSASPFETPPRPPTETPEGEVVDSGKLWGWWTLLALIPALAAAAAINGAVDRRWGGDWWVLSLALIIIPAAIVATKYWPAASTTRLRAGKTIRAAALAIGLIVGVLLAGVFQLWSATMDSAYYDGYDDGYLAGHNCALEWSDNYPAYRSCVDRHTRAVRTGIRPPAEWGR